MRNSEVLSAPDSSVGRFDSKFRLTQRSRLFDVAKPIIVGGASAADFHEDSEISHRISSVAEALRRAGCRSMCEVAMDHPRSKLAEGGTTVCQAVAERFDIELLHAICAALIGEQDSCVLDLHPKTVPFP